MTILNDMLERRKELLKMRDECDEPFPGYATARLDTLCPAIEQLQKYPEANKWN